MSRKRRVISWVIFESSVKKETATFAGDCLFDSNVLLGYGAGTRKASSNQARPLEF